MRRTLGFVLLSCGVVSCTFLLCGKKKEVKKPVAVLGTDTLTLERLHALSADTVHTGSELRSIMLQSVLAKLAPKPSDSAAYRKNVDELTQQLSLRSDRQWSTAEATLLLGAVRALVAKLDTAGDPLAVARRVDAVASAIVVLGDTVEPKTAGREEESVAATTDTGKVEKKGVLSAMIRRVFNLSPALADIMVDFSVEGTSLQADKEMSADLVKGLVYDSAMASEIKRIKSELRRRASSTPAPVPVRRDNWEQALKYRPRSSIVDSINKHLPYLQSLYKKKLRLHTDMAGKVVVSMRVAASGKVLSARVTRSDIRYEAFLDPLVTYVETIRFQPIPEEVGPTSVEFPFEFKAED